MVNSLDSNKPVAWVEVASDGTILGVSLDKDDTSPFILRPLYTAPVAQPKNEPDVFNKARFEKSPCYICGYNGPGYYQSNVHKCAAIYHGQVAQPDDRAVFEAFALSEGFVDSAAAWKNKEAAALLEGYVPVPKGWKLSATKPDNDGLCWLRIDTPEGSSAAFSAPASNITGQVIDYLHDALSTHTQSPRTDEVDLPYKAEPPLVGKLIAPGYSEDETDCPIHGKIGGINGDCPRC